MTEDSAGFLQVVAGEQVEIAVAKTLGPFAATFSSPIGASWDSASMSPDGLTETNVFSAPSAGSIVIVTILYDFVPDSTGNFPAGDQYVQTVTGSRSGAATPTTIPPPPINSQTLTFVVA
jgi:hypothetical protein